eukprot:7745579-Pyramimonas_sp.AAC.1
MCFGSLLEGERGSTRRALVSNHTTSIIREVPVRAPDGVRLMCDQSGMGEKLGPTSITVVGSTVTHIHTSIGAQTVLDRERGRVPPHDVQRAPEIDRVEH